MAATASTSQLWLFTGPEFGERNDTIEQYRQKAKKQFGILDEHSFYASETPIAHIISILQNGSLFASARFIVVRNAENIKKKEDIDALANWINATDTQSSNNHLDGSDAWLFLVSDETSIDKKLENIVPKQNRKIFWELFDDQKTRWLKNWFSKEGFSIDDDAIDAILDLVENNTESLRSECSRFSLCFDKGYHITVKDADTVLTHNRKESPFTLFAALCEHSRQPTERLILALGILQQIRYSKESSGIQLIAALSYCFRRLKTWHLIHDGMRPTDFDLKTKGFSSKKMQTQYAHAARVWTSRETVLCLSLLADTDMDIRSMGGLVEDTKLQQLLYALIIKRGRQLEVYTV